MVWSSSRATAGICLTLSLLLSLVSSKRLFRSTSLNLCQSDSSLTVSLFDIEFSPDEKKVTLDLVGDSTLEGNVTFLVQAAAYGYMFLNQTLDPCKLSVPSLCPISQIDISFNTTFFNVSSSIISKIPSVAYGIPDLDATVTVYMYSISNGTKSEACVQSQLSNGQTVDQNGVKWATAIIVVFGLIISGFISGLGHDNTAAHIALYASSLFNYFQSTAIVGLCAVPLPPIVQSWVQNFAWSIGIIKVHFLQKLTTWYQIATGGTPATELSTLGSKSVQALKRSVDVLEPLLQPREQTTSAPTGQYIVRGIQRVAFRAGMEYTNLFLTSIIFFCIFIFLALLCTFLFMELCGLAMRARWMQSHQFQTFREHWRLNMKGILLRLLLMGYPAIMILCFWEFTQRDSAAEVTLAVLFFIGISTSLALAMWKILQIAKRSGEVYKTPAYTLFSNATALNKWGFLYMQFRATACSFLVPILAYIVVKAAFVGFGQGSGTLQAIALVVIEAIALIGASIIRPWMDKPANWINISICAINFLNAVLLLIFTDIFNGPGLLIGVTGVIFFVVNAIFALVLLFVVLIASTLSFIRKNPESRYQPVIDNRASFINSQTMLTTELGTLGAIARGEKSGDAYKDSVGQQSALHGNDLQPPSPSLNTSYSQAPIPSSPRNDKFGANLDSHDEAYRPRLPYSNSNSPAVSALSIAR